MLGGGILAGALAACLTRGDGSSWRLRWFPGVSPGVSADPTVHPTNSSTHGTTGQQHRDRRWNRALVGSTGRHHPDTPAPTHNPSVVGSIPTRPTRSSWSYGADPPARRVRAELLPFTQQPPRATALGRTRPPLNPGRFRPVPPTPSRVRPSARSRPTPRVLRQQRLHRKPRRSRTAAAISGPRP